MLSVVIPCRDSSTVIRECLESLFQQRLDISLEILVIANPEELRIKNELNFVSPKKNMSLRFLCSPRANIAAAKNLGMVSASGTFIYMLDDDCTLPHENFLQDLLNQLQQTEASVLGGPYVSPVQAGYWPACYNNMVAIWMKLTGLPVGGNCLYRRKDLEGLTFSEERDYGGVETSLHLQLLSAGKRLHLDFSQAVLHNPQVSLRRLLRKAWKQGFAKGKFQQHYPRVSLKSAMTCFYKEHRRILYSAPYLGMHFIVMTLASLKSRWS